jgi:hypothetical protein
VVETGGLESALESIAYGNKALRCLSNDVNEANDPTEKFESAIPCDGAARLKNRWSKGPPVQGIRGWLIVNLRGDRDAGVHSEYVRTWGLEDFVHSVS